MPQVFTKETVKKKKQNQIDKEIEKKNTDLFRK